MNRKDRRAQNSKRGGKLRLIKGGKVDRNTLAKAVLRDQEDKQPPPQKFAEAMGVFLAAYDEHEKQLPADRRCEESDKLAVIMRVMCNRAILMEVPVDQFLDGVQMVYEQQQRQLEDESGK
jgi:hypothetical protein